MSWLSSMPKLAKMSLRSLMSDFFCAFNAGKFSGLNTSAFASAISILESSALIALNRSFALAFDKNFSARACAFSRSNE